MLCKRIFFNNLQISTAILLLFLVLYTLSFHCCVWINKKHHYFPWVDGNAPARSSVAIKQFFLSTSAPASSTSILRNTTVLSLDIDDVFISVKTTGKFHSSRLEIILKTWFSLAPTSIYFFTDTEDVFYKQRSKNHLINTKCGHGHYRQDLSCKMAAEYSWFVKSRRKWWCHFDDDNYVNINGLLTLLQSYDWQAYVYLGKLSVKRAMTTLFDDEPVQFWFATGGAGICISQTLAVKISPWCKGEEFVRTSEKLKLPDDCTLGFIITNRAGVELSQCPLFHSHLERLSTIKESIFAKQVSFSFQTGQTDSNVVKLKEPFFNASFDPTRMLSLHCVLYPDTAFCNK